MVAFVNFLINERWWWWASVMEFGLYTARIVGLHFPYRCLLSLPSLRWRSPWLVRWVRLELGVVSWTPWCSWACRGSDPSSSTSAEISSSRCRISLRTAALYSVHAEHSTQCTANGYLDEPKKWGSRPNVIYVWTSIRLPCDVKEMTDYKSCRACMLGQFFILILIQISSLFENYHYSLGNFRQSVTIGVFLSAIRQHTF